MPQDPIAFIGGGNMARSLIGGLVASGTPPDTLWATDVDESRLESLQADFRINTTGDNVRAVGRAGTVVLAVKPQVMAEVTRQIGAAARERGVLVVSIAAGVRADAIERWLGYEAPIVRTMPNTPALVGCGATGLFANRMVNAEQRGRAESIMRAVGITAWVRAEADLDAVTAVSGSGPAYFFRLMELMEEAGVELGLERETVRRLVLQTALGAARMAAQGEEPPGVLRERVTSPGGTTERALARFEAGGLPALVREALAAARDRAAELGDELAR